MAIYFDNSMVNVGGGSSEDLSAELAEYTALNAELEEVIDSLPDAGSGGSGTGSGVETCNVTFIYNDTATSPMDLSFYLNIEMITLALDEGVWYPYIYDDSAIANTTIVSSVITLYPHNQSLFQFSVESLDGTSRIIYNEGGTAEIYIGYSDTTITILDT